jgi:septal ring factor EnvC (AmiA/AmiB activator)
MEFIADALLIAGASGAAVYCMVLSRRLRALKGLDSGLGAAIATLSRQVDEMKGSLDAAKAVTGDQHRNLTQLTARAEMAAGRLELLLAALHENGRERPIGVTRREPRQKDEPAPVIEADLDEEDADAAEPLIARRDGRLSVAR